MRDFNSEKELETFNPENEPTEVFTKFNKVGNSFVFFNNTPIYWMDYYVTVEAVGIDSSTSELLLYNVGVLENKRSDINITLVVIFSIIGVLILGGIIAGIYIVYRKKLKDNNPSNEPINIKEG